MIDITLAAEASKNLLNVECPPVLLDRGCFSRRRFLSRKERKGRKELSISANLFYPFCFSLGNATPIL